MSWTVKFRTEVEEDMAEAAAWYEARQPGLGGEFVEEVIQVLACPGGEPVIEQPSPPYQEYPLAVPGTFSLSRHLRGV